MRVPNLKSGAAESELRVRGRPFFFVESATRLPIFVSISCHFVSAFRTTVSTCCLALHWSEEEKARLAGSRMDSGDIRRAFREDLRSLGLPTGERKVEKNSGSTKRLVIMCSWGGDGNYGAVSALASPGPVRVLTVVGCHGSARR